MIEKLLSYADVKINGGRPSDIKVNDDRFYKRVLSSAELGMGESYMEGWWDCERIDDLIFRILRADLPERIGRNFRTLMHFTAFKFLNLQSRSRAFDIGRQHYDMGNDLFKLMLDKRMNYSCAYWKDAKNLDEAQENKLDLICRKIHLKSGMLVLDIGCGWSAFAKFAFEKYKAETVGLTVSREQFKLGHEICRGLPIEIKLLDYRDINQKFDRIISVGMFEHVGYKNYRKFFRIAHKCLNDDGMFLLHTIGRNSSEVGIDAWTHKYIFPNGMLPSIAQIGRAVEGMFVVEDWHSFGQYYDNTLTAWRENFIKGWESIKQNYSESFYRMWNYYLLSCAGAFRARRNQLWQIVFTKKGLPGGYEPVR